MIKTFTLNILIVFCLPAATNSTALVPIDSLHSAQPIHSTNLTNSTIHIGAVIIHDTATSNITSTNATPAVHRYMITLTEPQVLICFAIAGMGVLIFLFIIINLIIQQNSL